MNDRKLQFIEKSSGERQSDLRKLIAYCNDPDPEVRMRAVERLRSTKSFDQPQVFMISTGDPDELVRIEALQALGVRKYAKAFLSSFIGTLNDRSDLVAAYAADGLRLAAMKSTKLILERQLLNASGHARASILGALQALGRPKALRDLLDMLRSPDYRVTCFVANLLTELKLTSGERRACVRALTRALTSLRGRAPREAVARTLSHFQRPAL